MQRHQAEVDVGSIGQARQGAEDLELDTEQRLQVGLTGGTRGLVGRAEAGDGQVHQRFECDRQADLDGAAVERDRDVGAADVDHDCGGVREPSSSGGAVGRRLHLHG
ncbi:hypothetical protein ASH02_05490 [Nocardioides sp. Soil796]|nr:hypothetical protein ASH02_05490 [Nocardioides sp. Soil796]